MSRLKIGFATSSKSHSPEELLAKLFQLLEISPDAIELSLTRLDKIAHPWTSEIFSQVKKFTYRSLHMPVRIDDDRVLRYPSSEAVEVMAILDHLIEQAQIETVLFHPDVVDDAAFLYAKYGSRLAFENMDVRKQFGKSPQDLLQLFQQAPQAKWVCDVNHVYTVDPTMGLATQLHQQLGDRLCHYHVSAYGGFHASFAEVGEEEQVILDGVLDVSKPLIHEGNAFEKGFARQEMEFLSECLQS